MILQDITDHNLLALFVNSDKFLETKVEKIEIMYTYDDEKVLLITAKMGLKDRTYGSIMKKTVKYARSLIEDLDFATLVHDPGEGSFVSCIDYEWTPFKTNVCLANFAEAE